jgi:Permuted papain-like amidase enzyme, YaeF/YiiX, C92 family
MMKRLLAILKGGGLLAAALAVLLYGWLSFTSVSAQNLPLLKDGDIIFQTSRSSQSLAILAASRSPFTHMGLIENRDGKAFVLEAAGPVKSTPLDQWIARGLGNRIMIKRLETLQPSQAMTVLAAAHRYDGLPYDVFFLSGKDEIYCSELVRLAFTEGAGLGIGKIQRVGDLDIDNLASRKLIEKRWRKHPLCSADPNETLQSCTTKIRDQQLVTPASIAQDAKLSLVYSNFGPLTE